MNVTVTQEHEKIRYIVPQHSSGTIAEKCSPVPMRYSFASGLYPHQCLQRLVHYHASRVTMTLPPIQA